MKKLLWLIPILLLLSCTPCPAVVNTHDEQEPQNCSRAYDAGYSKGRMEALHAFTVDLVPDSVYEEIYDKGYRHGQMCEVCPTEAEVLAFLESDDTDTMTYDKDFQCADFAGQLISRAWKQNIPAWLTIIWFKGENRQHTIVAFDTLDGLLFVEPQNDNVVDAVVGEEFMMCVGDFCKFFTISKVIIFGGQF